MRANFLMTYITSEMRHYKTYFLVEINEYEAVSQVSTHIVL